MGLFDFLLSSEETEETESSFEKTTILDREILKDQTQTRVQTVTEQEKQEAIREGEKTAQQTALETSLSEQNVAILDRVIQELAGKQSGVNALGQLSEQLPDQLSATLAQLVTNATGFDAETISIKEGLITSARNEFERGTGRSIRIGADAALGSRLGSTSRLIEDEAGANLSAQLAGLGAGVDERRSIERRNQLLSTLEGLASGERTAAAIEGDPLSQLLSALQVASSARKETVSEGAEQTTVKATQVSESQKQSDELIKLIASIVEKATTTATGTATGSSIGTATDSLLEGFQQLGAGFASIKQK